MVRTPRDVFGTVRIVKLALPNTLDLRTRFWQWNKLTLCLEWMIDVTKLSPLRYVNQLRGEAFHQTVGSETFHPVGCAEEPRKVDVYYLPDSDDPLDQDWIFERLGRAANSNVFSGCIARGFSEYNDYRKDLAAIYGESVESPIMDSLSNSLLLESGALALYETQGYVPFFRICSVCLRPGADVLVVSGDVGIDEELAEDGMVMRIAGGVVEIGDRGDFGDVLDLWRESIQVVRDVGESEISDADIDELMRHDLSLSRDTGNCIIWSDVSGERHRWILECGRLTAKDLCYDPDVYESLFRKLQRISTALNARMVLGEK